MFANHITGDLLEIQWALFEAGVHLTVDEDAGVEVLLSEFAEDFVFRDDLGVEFVDELEVFLAGVFVAVDLVVH